MQKAYETISSRQNPLVKLAVSLADRKNREREGLFRFDGRKLFFEALSAHLPLYALLVRASSFETIFCESVEKDLPSDCRVALLDDALFDRVSEENAPDGVISLARRPLPSHYFVSKGEEEALSRLLLPGHTLLVESVRDPGNLGTMIRSATAFGVPNLVLSSDCADIYHPKTLRAAMGALFGRRVVVTEDLVGAMHLLRRRGRVFAAALDPGAAKLGEVAFGENDAVLVGNEGHGLSPAALSSATDKLFIPMEPGVESLNAGVAASVLLFELYRGR